MAFYGHRINVPLCLFIIPFLVFRFPNLSLAALAAGEGPVEIERWKGVDHGWNGWDVPNSNSQRSTKRAKPLMNANPEGTLF
jgi:hypothetical protein